MARYIRNTAILAKIETTYGTDPTPTGAANALLVSNVGITPLVAKNVDRDLLRPYFGASEQLVGIAHVEFTCDVEIQGAGAAGTAPAWGPLLRACAFAETISAGTRVEYDPVSQSIESLTAYYYDDGILHKLFGARGDFSVKLNAEGRPVFSFKFQGLDGAVSAAALPALTLTGWKTPSVVTDSNTADLLWGCTYATGALSGGTAYPSRGIELTVGNQVDFTELLGGESIDITDRSTTGKASLDLTAAQEVTLMTDVKANTLTSMGIVHGLTAGYKVLFYAPAVQRINPKKEALGKRRLIGVDLRLTPTSAGNNELKIVAL